MTGPLSVTNPVARVAAAPRPPASPPRSAARTVPETGGVPLFTWVRLHALAIAFWGTLLGSGLAYAAWSLLPAEYESYAALRVSSAQLTVSNQRDPGRAKTDFTTYLKTNSRLITYDFVLNKALDRPQSGDAKDVSGPRIAALATLKEQKDPIKFLGEKLEIKWEEGSEVVRVFLKGTNPTDIQMIVNAVVDAFMVEVVEKEVAERGVLLKQVEKELTRLTDALLQKVGGPEKLAPAAADAAGKRVDPLVIQANGVGPAAPAAVRQEMTRILFVEIARLRTQVESLPLTIGAQKARVESLQKQIDLLTRGEPSKETLEQVNQDPAVRDLRAKAQYYRTKYQQDVATYANPEADSIKAALVQAESAEKAVEKLRVEKAIALETLKRQGRADAVFLQLDEAKRLLATSEHQFAADQKALEMKVAQIQQLPPDPVKDAEVKQAAAVAEKKGPVVNPEVTSLQADDDIYRNMTTYASQLRLDQNSPKRVNVLQQASAPSQKDPKKQYMATAVAGLMGFALAGFVAVGAEFKARKISSLGELRSQTATPVVGVIPWRPGATQAPETGEGIDKLRSFVAQTWLARGATTIAVTSAMGDEGKAFAAFELAQSLAAGGYKTLLVDFDLRTPALHPLAGAANDAGVCELLRGEADFRKTIQLLPTGLHFLAAGTWSDDARRAAVGGRLEALLGRLREPFDCVVLHAHSLLTAAETVEVARRCEVVLLCTQYRETRMPLLKRAADRIAVMEIPHAGVVYVGATAQESLC